MVLPEMIGTIVTYVKDPAILAVIFGVVTVLTILIVVMRSVTPVMPYLFANSRIQARSTGLIDEKRFGELVQSKKLTDLAAHLQDTEFAGDLADVKDLKGFQIATENSFRNSVEELKGMSPKQIHPVFDSYLMLWEAKVIKTIYRALFTGGLSKKKLKNGLVFPVGNITETQLGKMLESESLNDLGVAMSQTTYAPVFEDAYSNLLEFEVAIDRFVLERYRKAARKASKAYDAELIIEILNRRFDILNILFLLKAMERKLEPEKKLDLLIPTDTELSRRFKKLVSVEGLDMFIEELKGLPYYNSMKEAFDKMKGEKKLLLFEIGLQKDYKNYIKQSEIVHSQGPYPLFAYLTKKEIELKNLNIISKGIVAGFAPKEIEELLI